MTAGPALRGFIRRAWSRADETPTDRLVRAAVVVALLLLVAPGNPRPAVVLYLLLFSVLLLLSLRWRMGAVVLIVLFAAAVETRIAAIGFGRSDVLAVEVAGIERALAGLNPYGVGYEISIPPGSPFAYGPLSLAWYLPFRAAPQAFETLISALILGVLTVRGRPLGLALYAFTPALIVTAGDGSNDTSAGLLLLAALAAAASRPILGGALLGIAMGFKPYAAAWAPALAAYGGRWSFAAFTATALAAWAPALALWGPGPIVASFQLAQAIHTSPYYSLGFLLQSLLHAPPAAEVLDRGRLVLGGITALVGALCVRTVQQMVLAGLVTYLVTLYLGYWSTFSYLAAVAPTLCWYLDDWLGLGDARVRWPWQPPDGRPSGGSRIGR